MKKINPRIVELKVYKKRQKRKHWVKNYNRFKNSLSKKYRPEQSNNELLIPNVPTHRSFDLREHTKILFVPQNFSLITNTEGVLEFSEKCKRISESDNKNLFLDFSKVEEVTQGAMSLLLSITHDLNLNGIGVSGGYPKNSKARMVFERCGFLEFFRTNISRTFQHNNTILVRGLDKIDQIRTAPQVETAMQTVFGTLSRNQKLQGMIIELMANSVNHAFVGTNKNTNWYLSVFHEEENKKVKFCFIDNGEGILSTINMKFIQTVTANLAPETTIRKAFNGEYQSRTGLSERGKGLIMVKSCFVQNIISNLKVITNNLFYDFKTDSIILLRTEFRGTFYFWELDTTCKYVSY